VNLANRLYQGLLAFWNLLLYGNFWIAFGAAAMGMVSRYFVNNTWEVDASIGFLFFSTLFTYSLHRVVGLEKTKNLKLTERYQVIRTFKKHIQVYAVLGALGSLYFFLQLQFQAKCLTIMLSILAFAYVLPLLNGKRLRDFHYVKVFLVAIVWAGICTGLPVLNYTGSMGQVHTYLLLEHTFFVFGITLPFDIRDQALDSHVGVKTMVNELGVQKSKLLIYLALMTAGLLACLVAGQLESGGVYLSIRLALYGFLILAVRSLKTTDSDYKYSGLLDGSLIFGPLIFAILNNYMMA
jgi:hypothetical protein